jgi:hypothetical protein
VTAPRLVLRVAAALLSLLASRLAGAQVHWDAAAEAGVTKRFQAGGEAGAPTPGVGPSLELQGHVALLPMIRVGAYLGTDLSPAVGRGATSDGPRAFVESGLHVRVSPPLVPWPWRTWLFAGFGYAEGHDLATRLSGGMLDVPLGLGVGRKVTPRWWLFSELGARFGFAFQGALYDAERAGIAGQGGSIPYAGKDVFALSLSVGLSLDR